MSHLLTEAELIEYAKGENLIDRLRGLLDQQKSTWPVVEENYNNLGSVITREIYINGATIKLQYNPHRIQSTTADLSKVKSKDTCFLCENNLPEDQKYLRYYKEYNFLVNPYPIFPEHFTVPKIKHVPQSIGSYLNDLLLLSRDVGERYAVFYNGPDCGASIPEHLHFQMGNKEALPIFAQTENLHNKNLFLSIQRKKISLQSIELTKRIVLKIQSNDTIEILNCISVLMINLKNIGSKAFEPMMNIVCNYENKLWTILIFLRNKHRPGSYFLEGKNQILVSPAAVDLSGLIVVPRNEDFEKLTADKVLEIYREVSFSKEYNLYLTSKLKEFYS